MSREEGISIGAGFPHLPDLVFGPLTGRPEADWHRAPPGKWTPAQIAEHLTKGLDRSSRRFEEQRAKPPMRRRPRTWLGFFAYHSVIGLSWFPSGFTAPDGTQPADRPAPAAVQRTFRDAHARFLELQRTLLPARRHDLFVKHPVLGDLTLDEWMRFHTVHCRHHARQIRERLLR
jgi:hypothetical protein